MGLFGPPDIKKLKAEENIKGLIKALKYKKSIDIPEKAAKALGKIGDKEAVKPLIKALKKKKLYYDFKKTHVMFKMGELGIGSVEQSDKFGRIRVAAATALGAIKDTRAIDPLIDLLNDEITEVRKATEKALVNFGEKACGRLKRILFYSTHPFIEGAAKRILRKIERKKK